MNSGLRHTAFIDQRATTSRCPTAKSNRSPHSITGAAIDPPLEGQRGGKDTMLEKPRLIVNEPPRINELPQEEAQQTRLHHCDLPKRSPKCSCHQDDEHGDKQTMMLAVTLAIKIKASDRSKTWNCKLLTKYDGSK